jgi:hypothetical protein
MSIAVSITAKKLNDLMGFTSFGPALRIPIFIKIGETAQQAAVTRHRRKPHTGIANTSSKNIFSNHCIISERNFGFAVHPDDP